MQMWAIAGFKLQTVTILKRATTVEFYTISTILYIHCYRLVFIHFGHFIFQFATEFLSARVLG